MEGKGTGGGGEGVGDKEEYIKTKNGGIGGKGNKEKGITKKGIRKKKGIRGGGGRGREYKNYDWWRGKE